MLRQAYAFLDNEWFEDWQSRYRTEIHNQEEAMAVVEDQVENDFIVLGANAIEDKLQDGVPKNGTVKLILHASKKGPQKRYKCLQRTER